MKHIIIPFIVQKHKVITDSFIVWILYIFSGFYLQGLYV